MKNWDPDRDKRRHLRWMEMMWERRTTIAREEKRKEEVLRIFEDLGELSKRGPIPEYFPPWESYERQIRQGEGA